MEFENKLDDNERELNKLICKLSEILSYFKDEIEFRESHLEEIETLISDVPPTLTMKLRINDIKHKYLLSKNFIQEFANFIPKFKYLNLKFNSLLTHLESCLENNEVQDDIEAVDMDGQFREDEDINKKVLFNGMVFCPFDQNDFAPDTLSTASSSTSKNMDLEEIKQNSIMIFSPSNQNVQVHRKPRTKKKKGYKDIEVKSLDFEKLRDRQESAKNESSHEKDQPQDLLENKILIRTNSRVCPVTGCNKHFNSAPSIKYHICTKHPGEAEKYRLGQNYVRVAQKRLNQSPEALSE